MDTAREDAIKVRKLVKMSHKNRQTKAILDSAPAPTPRTADSLSAVHDPFAIHSRLPLMMML